MIRPGRTTKLLVRLGDGEVDLPFPILGALVNVALNPEAMIL
jgi:hypothetical protein